jgi:hypothetical protein
LSALYALASRSRLAAVQVLCAAAVWVKALLAWPPWLAGAGAAEAAVASVTAAIVTSDLMRISLSLLSGWIGSSRTYVAARSAESGRVPSLASGDAYLGPARNADASYRMAPRRGPECGLGVEAVQVAERRARVGGALTGGEGVALSLSLPASPSKTTSVPLTLIVLALIAIAVGDELAIAHPGDDPTLEFSILTFGGPALFLLAQLFFLRSAVGRLARDWLDS